MNTQEAQNKVERHNAPQALDRGSSLSPENCECREVFVVTAFGVGIDTEVHLCRTHEEAEGTARELLSDWQMTDPEEMCYDCWKGYSKKAQCDIEIEIHGHSVPKWMSIHDEVDGK